MLRRHWNLKQIRPEFFHVETFRSMDAAQKRSHEMHNLLESLSFNASQSIGAPRAPRGLDERPTEWAAYVITYDPVDSLKVEYALTTKGKKNAPAAYTQVFPENARPERINLWKIAAAHLIDEAGLGPCTMTETGTSVEIIFPNALARGLFALPEVKMYMKAKMKELKTQKATPVGGKAPVAEIG